MNNPIAIVAVASLTAGVALTSFLADKRLKATVRQNNVDWAKMSQTDYETGKQVGQEQVLRSPLIADLQFWIDPNRQK